MNAMTKFAATIGLDWADQKHDLWIQPADGSKAEHRQLEHTPEALHEWVAKLRERFGNRPVAIGIETCRGAVISALMAYDFIVFFPINPKLESEMFMPPGRVQRYCDSRLFEGQFCRSGIS